MVDLAQPPTPVDVDRSLADSKTYEEVILKIFTKRSQRGQSFAEVDGAVSYDGTVTYFDTAAGRGRLARAIAGSVADGSYVPQPVELWTLETKGKQRCAHKAVFADHVVGSALYQLLTRNARCYGLPGVYSYLPAMTNVGALRGLGAFIRAHRKRVGPKGPPLYVLQSDFEHYGDNLPMGPDAPLWRILGEVAGLGNPTGKVSANTWELVTALARPVVTDADGGMFTRLRGVAMGTPMVPVLANLAVIPMDDAILATDGIFYARYNDDFLLAHPDLDALRETDARIDSLVGELGVKRKAAKEIRTTLSATGMSSVRDPAYRGANRIDYLGLSVNHAGAITVGPNRLRRFIERIASRIDGAMPALAPLPTADRARQLVAMTNIMLDVTNPFAVSGLSALLDTTTDRSALKDLDFRIARKIAQAATGYPGVRGFRHLPPSVLRAEMGLVSLVRLKNLR